MKADHVQAIFFRRYQVVKRTWKPMVVSFGITLMFTAFSIVEDILVKSLLGSSTDPVTFASFQNHPTGLMFVGNESLPFERRMRRIFIEMFRNDTGKDPIVYNFTTRDQLNEFVYNFELEKRQAFIAAGYGFRKDPNDVYQFDIWYNSTEFTGDYNVANVQLFRALWKDALGNDVDFIWSPISVVSKLMDIIFAQVGPMLVTCGLISFIPQIITQPIMDVRGPVREYMMSCTLSLTSYWIAIFLMDLALWIITAFFVWALFMICRMRSFLDNPLTAWYSLTVMGPGYILFLYCTSFLFQSAESASRQVFLGLVVIELIPMIIEMVRTTTIPMWMEVICSLIPTVSIQRILSMVLVNIGVVKKSLKYYMTENEHTRLLLLMQGGNVIIYGVILALVERYRLRIQSRKAKAEYGNYCQLFETIKSKSQVTPEALEMEKEVADSDDYAVRVYKVCRLFFNTDNQPLPAVNSVSLGVKRGSIFGFLGANGAGKTTLIRMIAGMLPLSSGSIQINGREQDGKIDGIQLAICPQFNTHLCEQLTPDEHFLLYSKLFQMSDAEYKRKTQMLISQLELDQFRDKPLRELSEGDVRKLAIALCFFSPAEIIILDEPTATLDPIARQNVQAMIRSYRGKRTIMLCTHLLGEAESLCNTISIMIKGCVYTQGTPAHLTDKFGKSYKVDVVLADESLETANLCCTFFEQKLPNASLSIARRKVQVYDVPASDIKLHELFEVMETATATNSGIVYYTCSMSSLERVFMELIKLSELDGI